MKLVYILSTLTFIPTLAVADAGTDALKLVPARDLQGISIVSCEKKAGTYTVSCKASGCTVNIVAEKFQCKGVRN